MFSPPHVILLKAKIKLLTVSEFRHKRTIGGEVMTSYRFFKMAVIESEIYFRFRFWWWYSLRKMGI